MDALTRPEAAEGSEAAESATEELISYPHLWFDDQGRHWIDDTNVKVIEVVLDHTGYGWSADEIHRQYPYLSLAQIHSALAYYFDHKQEIDEEIQRQRAEYEELRAKANAESPFLKRMRALGKLP
jgi:uncharacterized protein (DUF433 family)